ncbi:MAG: protein-L-isoaspartate O-methyltransferase [Burkholderiaceae bacterium]|jgi:protein-L-isoaspartate(D-aspartate) O-methyltransferase|nr:protein-L-isoaspartate O-methyltransferase [Burkholderiaceae bacterium]
MNVEQARFNMIEQQIRPWDVLDPHVLDLLAVVRREDFVPAAYRGLAFADIEIPLRDNPKLVAAGQVMLPPRLEARLLQDLAVAKHENVLEIGTGSGFMAALLGHRAQRVVTLEIDSDMAQRAHTNLQRAGVLNVEVRVADGASADLDLSADSPFDAILLSGSVAELPVQLLPLLKPGGRLLAIVGEPPVMRATLVHSAGTEPAVTQLWDTGAPALLNFPRPPRFRF